MKSPPIVVTGGSGFIGTNLVARLRSDGLSVLNYDRRPPMDPSASSAWRSINLEDRDALLQQIKIDRPERIIHLAAETRIDGFDEEFACNLITTKHLLDACRIYEVKRVVIASTMLVHPLGSQPRGELPGSPTTAYGRSKAAMELMVRENAFVNWSIVRPTTIWGPWHVRLAHEFIRRVAKGQYAHPNTPCQRSYGYVGNVCHQIISIMEDATTLRRSLFVGDPPIDLATYVDAFSVKLRGKPARRVPKILLAGAARIGDGLQTIGIPFPLSTYRLGNMTQNNIIDMTETIAITGPGPSTLEQGVSTTVHWWHAWTS